MHRDRFQGISRTLGLRLAATALVLLGLLTGLVGTGNAGAQTAAVIELRVHSCPDDFAGTGFYQHLTQCTSERSLYGVGVGVQAGQDDAVFQYSQPDDTGRAELMRWDAVLPGTVTVTEVAPDPIKPSVAFCSLQPTSGGPLTMDGEEVPLDDGVMTISLNEGDTLMCDWYRFPGGITTGDPGDGDDGGGDEAGADRDGDGLLDDDETDFYGTDPDNPDTDGDEVSDGNEVSFNTDPLVADAPTTRTDTDEDGLYDDDEEQLYNTDPLTFDTDGDGVGDGEEVVLNTDPTVADGGTSDGGDNGNGGDNGAAPQPTAGVAAGVAAAEPDVASVMVLLLGMAGVDYSVPEADLKQWLGEREFTSYPALAEALLIALDGKQLRQPVYLDVIVWNYEQAANGSSPRDISEVDFVVLRVAVVQAYNERYDETVEDFQSLLQ